MEGAVAVAERIRRNIENEVIEYGGNLIKKTASFGVAVFPECADDMDSLIKAAGCWPRASRPLEARKLGSLKQVSIPAKQVFIPR